MNEKFEVMKVLFATKFFGWIRFFVLPYMIMSCNQYSCSFFNFRFSKFTFKAMMCGQNKDSSVLFFITSKNFSRLNNQFMICQ